jgi:hypothetical protein
VSVNGTLVEDKMRRFGVNVHLLDPTSVPFTLTKVQVPNLALTHILRITVHVEAVQQFFYHLIESYSVSIYREGHLPAN